MPVFENLFLAVLTKNEDDAGSSCTLNVTVNVDGQDILDDDYGCDLDDGEAGLLGGGALVTSLDTTGVTNSSIRVGIRDDDAWGPEHVLLFGQTRADFRPGRTAALAIETEVSRWLSTDASEGRLSMPVRLVGSGDADTVIRRVLLLVDTIWQYDSDAETDSPVQLQVAAGGNIVLQQQIPDTPQPDLEAATSNWYLMDAAVPFTRANVISGGGIRVSILGADAWKPMRMFVFGFDTASGRPNEVVTLVSVPVWTQGWLSTDPQEGLPSIDLPVVSV